MCGWNPRAIDVCALLLTLTVTACSGIHQQVPRADPFSLSLPRVGGGTVRLDKYRGQVLMLDFFTTWSQASMLSIPGYSALYQRYQARGLRVVGVALDDLGETIVAPYKSGMEIPYPIALATKSIRRGDSPFGEIEANPLLFIFDRQGNLRKMFIGHVPLDKVEEVITKLLP